MKKNRNSEDRFLISMMSSFIIISVSLACLCLTTYAWFTGSVSTGVNSITAGVNVTVTVNNSSNPKGGSNSGINTFILSEGTNTVIFSKGSAYYGYYALLTIGDESETSSLVNYFFTPAYAENVAYYAIKIPKDGWEITVNISSGSKKSMTVNLIWAKDNKDDNDFVVKDQTLSYPKVNGITYSIKNNSDTIIIPDNENSNTGGVQGYSSEEDTTLQEPSALEVIGNQETNNMESNSTEDVDSIKSSEQQENSVSTAEGEDNTVGNEEATTENMEDNEQSGASEDITTINPEQSEDK